MDHLAILSKEGNLLGKILSGEKKIESRWYKSKKTPYQNIAAGDIVYFKESGELVSAKAGVAKVLFFDKLHEQKIKDLLAQYAKELGVPMSYLDKIKGKNFCTFIFLENVEQIEPFAVDKKGFGMMAAWITVKSIEMLKR